MKLFLLEPGRQLVEECLLFLCSILQQPPSHPIPHPHCFLPSYSAINQIKKETQTNLKRTREKKKDRVSWVKEMVSFPGGSHGKLGCGCSAGAWHHHPFKEAQIQIISYPSYTAHRRDLLSARKWKVRLYFSRFSSYSYKTVIFLRI